MRLWKIMKGLGISIMAYLSGQHLAQVLISGNTTGANLDLALGGGNKSFSVSSQTTSPRAVYIKPDGTKMYVCNFSGYIYQYSLSTAWDVSTATLDGTGTINDGSITPKGMFIKSDGLKAYFIAEYNILQWDLSSAWDFVGYSRSGSDKFIGASISEYNGTGIAFSSDGLKCFVLGQDLYTLFEFSLSSAWDISTASYSNNNYALTGIDATPYGIFLGNSDANMYFVGDTNNSVYPLFFGSTLPTVSDENEKKKTLGFFRRLIRGGALKALQANSTASAIIGDSQTATDEINSL